MKLWFQAVLAIGILSVSAASISYTWRTYRIYKVEKDAEMICRAFLNDDLEKADESNAAETLLAWRQCISNVLSPSQEPTSAACP
jgi:hypothetical protein